MPWADRFGGGVGEGGGRETGEGGGGRVAKDDPTVVGAWSTPRLGVAAARHDGGGVGGDPNVEVVTDNERHAPLAVDEFGPSRSVPDTAMPVVAQRAGHHFEPA